MPDIQQLYWLFFKVGGRISRAAYLLGGLLANLVPAFLLYRFVLAQEESPESGAWALSFFAAGLVCVWAIFALSVKRLHDFGKPGVFAITLFIPVISYIAFIAFCLIPGDPGPNRYGATSNSPH
ncbi:DUF805 domain-containing protein [Nitratireductor mangrovi]|uniref:DUF805 domain-containing protein n=1 Tax=Nitratireductor mangrovi TaxID=2599600 RepID=A0A5B8L0H5_9HYPH|nr:DUF805 domain-containing protein [Nitratireductor mangrovi]QDZ01202.1 DUF805 domain-containing protein [Nitratireductor mangrovi]